MFRRKPKPQTVEPFGLFRCLAVVFSQVAHHFAPGHFAKGGFFQDPAVFLFAKNTGDEPNAGGKMRRNTAAVFFRRKI